MWWLIAVVLVPFGFWFFTIFQPSIIEKNKDLEASIKLLQKDIEHISETRKKLLSDDVRKAATTDGQDLRQNLESINSTLRLAQEQSIVLDREATIEAGKALFNRAITSNGLSGEVWNTATRLVAYQTFADGQTRPLIMPGDARREPFTVEPGAEGRYILQGIWLEGVTQTLDGIVWEGGVFNKCHIIYKGGFLRLNNVRFIDCTFEIEKTPKGAKFGEAVLASISASVDLTAKT